DLFTSNIFNLDPTEFTVTPAAGAGAHDTVALNRLSLSHKAITDAVLVKVVIEHRATHQAGDEQFYFGDEPLQVGQPVVDAEGNLTTDASGNMVLYTASTVVDRLGNQKYHQTGEPVY